MTPPYSVDSESRMDAPSYCWRFARGSLDVHKIIGSPQMRFIRSQRRRPELLGRMPEKTKDLIRKYFSLVVVGW